MKVSIIGHGFVGKAIENGFKNVETYIVDPRLGTSIDDLDRFKPNIIFICVPTPMGDDGSQNIDIALNTINHIKKLNFKPLVVMKSSVIPSKIYEFENAIENFVYNPEFLREKHANDDFINSEIIIFGGNNDSCSELASFYNKHTLCKTKNYCYTDAVSASLCKYSINSFLATKVIFFNEMKNIFDRSQTKEEWSNFISIISKDPRIGESHMDVPGHDGRKGFGGACFPKDTYALLKFSQGIEQEFNLLKEAIGINNSIREGYNELTDREKEQKVSFTFKEGDC